MNTVRRVREPIVDGLFYSSEASTLTDTIVRLSERVDVPKIDAGRIVAPHATYEYCGPSIASSYKSASGRSFDVVVIIAPVHREPSNSIILTESEIFTIPTGSIEVDIEAVLEVEACSTKIIRNDVPHLEEHAVEVQLPFVRHFFPNAKIVPVLLGSTTAANVRTLSRALESAFPASNESVLFVASSNLCAGCTPGRAETEIALLSSLIESKDADGIVSRYEARELTACGCGCIASILTFGGKAHEVCAHTRTESPVDDTEGTASTWYGSFSFHPAAKEP